MAEKRHKDQLKVPRTGLAVSPTKTPSAQSAAEPAGEFPSWKISLLEMADPYGWHVIDEDKLHTIRKRLANFESMTWHQILIEGKKHHHSIPVNQLAPDAQARLAQLRQDDVEKLGAGLTQTVCRLFRIAQNKSALNPVSE